ncbi:MAG: hypothetical protein V3S89_02255 [Desulfobacterales bacterium]
MPGPVHPDEIAGYLDPSGMKSVLLKFFILAGMLLGLPMIGVFLADLPVSRFLEFPPETRYVGHAPFSWIAFGIFCLIILSAILPLVRLHRRPPSGTHATQSTPFPWWGWTGVLLGIAAWITAWSRFSWFTAFQPHTFTPLWISYILVINALTYRQTRHCMMVDRPGIFLSLFPASATFWWFFEYLNRFVQNWHYGAVDFTATEYFWYATLPFATVLPAVLSTRDLIISVFRLESGLQGPCLPEVFRSPQLAGILLVTAGASLAGIGVWPDVLFPLLWVSPLLIIIALQSLMGGSLVLSELCAGKWGQVVTSALAALLCGFFWEMWNFFSYARWEYTVPFVHRFLIFEMPILGYAGYLPFGLECIVIGQMIESLHEKHIPA